MPALYAFDAYTKYVDAINGNDANSGDSESDAYQTLAAAKAAAPQWATIFVAPGDYDENNLFGNFTWVFSPGATVIYTGSGAALFDGTDTGWGGTGICRVLGQGDFYSDTGLIALSYSNSVIEFEYHDASSSGPCIALPFAEDGIKIHIEGKHISSDALFLDAGLMQFASVATITGKIGGFTGLSTAAFMYVAVGSTCNVNLEVGNVIVDADSAAAVSFSSGTCLLKNGSIKSNGYSLANNGGTDARIILQGIGLLPGDGHIVQGDGDIYLDSACVFDKSNVLGNIKFGALDMVPGINEPRTYYVDIQNGNIVNSGLSRSAAKQNLWEAKLAAQSGDTIVVMRGTYDENNLIKDGVNWHFERGAVVSCTEESETAIWDDGPNGANAACSFQVTGHGTFSSTYSDSCIVNLINEGSRASIQGDSFTTISKLITLATNAHLSIDVDYTNCIVNAAMITVENGARLIGKVGTLIQDTLVIPPVSVSIETGGYLDLQFDYFQSSALLFFDVNGDSSYLRLQGGTIRHVNGESLEPHEVTAIEASNLGRADIRGVTFLIGPEEEGLPRYELVNVPGEDSIINVDSTCHITQSKLSGHINYGDSNIVALNNFTNIDGYTVAQAMAILMAVAAGKVDGSSGSITSIRSLNDEKDRVVADVDSVGNRTSIAIDVEDLI